MFESKDASKSDERRVKNTLNSKPLTRKRKGETDTMFNRGIQLSVFFVISLMLIAAVFSNTAMAAANDGEGIVTVGWNLTDADPTAEIAGSNAVRAEAGSDIPSPIAIDSNSAVYKVGVSTSAAPLAAGSSRNVLQFTYTAIDNVKGATALDLLLLVPDADADSTIADENDKPINMAGGRVRIAVPNGWKVSNKFLRVYDGLGADFVIGGVDVDDLDATRMNADTLIYSTDEDGTVIEHEDHKGRVSFTADKYITVDLDAKWGPAERRVPATIGRQLVIIFGDVTTIVPRMLDETDNKGTTTGADATDDDVPYFAYSFQASSSARNGTLIRFDSPGIRVGNILGEKTKILAADDDVTADADYAGRDTLERKVTITPTHVFAGEKEHKFTISFTATGPMYGATLTIPIPDGLRSNGGLLLTQDGDDDTMMMQLMFLILLLVSGKVPG